MESSAKRVGGGALDKEIRKAHVAMAMVQLFNGGYRIITKVALNVRVNQLVFRVYKDLLALSILTPIAYIHEKRIQPPMTKRLLLSLFFLGLTSIFGNQLLFLLGLSYINPTYAAVIQPSIPVFTFLLAIMMGTERVSLLRSEGQAKAGGTLVCVFSAILMVLFQDSIVSEISAKGQLEPTGWFFSSLLNLGLEGWHLGVLCLIGNCMCMAAFLAIQAPLLTKYHANILVTAYSYAFGALLMVLTALFMTNEAMEWSLVQSELWAVIYAVSYYSLYIFHTLELSWDSKPLSCSMKMFSSMYPLTYGYTYCVIILGLSPDLLYGFLATLFAHRETLCNHGVTAQGTRYPVPVYPFIQSGQYISYTGS
ncbi:hypothetical protein P3X46_025963 [Hevea brasiliensis]|uniref:WAT1-related protein n=1 Tax=Hevea brasiliensis TaxID=3981 RepID=A0ABQ9KYH5_HEVBR|nr:hypothetical protein P3X46_025963 [Hevea brasiliensis]